MTIEQFVGATHYVKSTMIKFHGMFLMERSFGTVIVKFYQLDDFYVEVVLSSESDSTPCMKSYRYNEIDDYLPLIDISAIQSLLA